MIWTIIKADLLWTAIFLPLSVGVQVLVALHARRAAKRQSLSMPAWARGERTAAQKWKLALMRSRSRRPR